MGGRDQLMDGVLDQRHCGAGVEDRADEQHFVHSKAGQVDFRLGVGLNSEIVRIRDNSDHGNLCRMRT